MQFRKAFAEPGRCSVFNAPVNDGIEGGTHPADQYAGRQIAAVRVQSDVSQAQLARSIGISFQQLQKYENARNRVTASMLIGFPAARLQPVRSRFANSATIRFPRRRVPSARSKGCAPFIAGHVSDARLREVGTTQTRWWIAARNRPSNAGGASHSHA